jgi:hypothetical protein
MGLEGSGLAAEERSDKSWRGQRLSAVAGYGSKEPTATGICGGDGKVCSGRVRQA